jgi:HAD superfamily hydrolase (TIGR01509 family)
MTLKGFIFDFDGLILDTEKPGFMAWKMIFDRYNQPFTLEDWKKAIGTGPSAFDPARHLCALVKDSPDPSRLQEEQLSIANEFIRFYPILPGVLEFITEAKAAVRKLAIASSSPRSWVIGHLYRLELIPYFDIILTAEDVPQVKPAPDLYLLALSRLELTPAEAVVFEDSPAGILAANAAGITCIAVPNEITRTMDISHADVIVNSFEEISLLKLDDGFFLH